MSTSPARSTNVLEELELFPGDFVKAKYYDHEFYLATVELDKQTGNFVVRWTDTGEVMKWEVQREELKLLVGRSRPGKPGTAAVQFFPGDVVWAKWIGDGIGDGNYYMATLEKRHADGTFTLQWADNSVFETKTDPSMLKGVPFYHRGHGVRFYLPESSRCPQSLDVSLEESAESGSPTAQTVPPSSREDPSSESEFSLLEDEEEEEEPCFVERPMPPMRPLLQKLEPRSTETLPVTKVTEAPPVIKAAETPQVTKGADLIAGNGKSEKWSKLAALEEAPPFSFASAEPMPEPAPSVPVEGAGAPRKHDGPLAVSGGAGTDAAALAKEKAGSGRAFRMSLKPSRGPSRKCPTSLAAPVRQGSLQSPSDCPTFPMHEDEPSTEEEMPASPKGGMNTAATEDGTAGEQLDLDTMYASLGAPLKSSSVWG